MRILTIGAGVIGTTYSWQMHTAGFHVTHLVRKEKLELYQHQGIQIRCLDLRKNGGLIVEECYRPEFVDTFQPDDGYDYILVSVNSHQLADLLPELKTKSGKSTIVFLQNLRIGDDELIDQQLDPEQYIIAYPFKAGGGRTGNAIDTVIFGMKLSNTVIGEVDGTVTSRVKTFHHVLKKAGMNPQIIHDIIPYVRTHYVWASCCVAAYLRAGSFDRFKQDDAIKESYLAMREGWRICEEQGIDPRKVAPTKLYYLPFPILVPFTRWLYNQKGMREMFEGHIQHSPDEMKDMYFTLLSMGKEYGISMPVYQSYQKDVEQYFRQN